MSYLFIETLRFVSDLVSEVLKEDKTTLASHNMYNDNLHWL